MSQKYFLNKYSYKQLFKSYIKNLVLPYRISKKDNKNRLKIVLDCANGATYDIAPQIFAKVGFSNILVINNNPDGTNINVNSGVVNIHKSIHFLKNNDIKFEFLILFDGDGDRIHIVDKKFRIYDGDALLAVFTYYYKVVKQLKLDCIVGTVMSNRGLEKFCKKIDVKFVRTVVGDRNVTSEVIKRNTFLGGETSGHIVNLKINSFGDGILNGLLFLKIICENPKIIDEVLSLYKPFKSYLLNVKVKNKIALDKLENFSEKVAQYNDSKGENVRVVVRYSGTENVLRILVESEKKKDCVVIANELKNLYYDEMKKLHLRISKTTD